MLDPVPIGNSVTICGDRDALFCVYSSGLQTVLVVRLGLTVTVASFVDEGSGKQVVHVNL
jgi:hypothetical protein